MENDNVTGQEQEQQEQGQQRQQQEQGGGEKTFTQAEVDTMINNRLARERKNQPSADELAEFRKWKQAQQTPEERQAATQAKVDSALADAEMVRRENYLLRQGIDPDDVDYYVYKISKAMKDDEEFEDAAKAFLKDHKAGKHGGSGVRVDLGGRLNGDNSKKTANQQMNDILRRARGTSN